MAFDNDQKEFPVPTGSDADKRKTAEFLPKYFRTPVNSKFLHATMDQLVSAGTLEKINAYYGRKITPAYQSTDLYVADVSSERENYKFEPAILQQDDLGNVNFYKDYLDYVNQINNLGGKSDDHSLLNAQEYYAWSPKINWDKFVNFREYFWMPYGASTVTINGQQRNVVSTYTVTTSDQGDNYAYIFTPDGVTANPTISLYRGQTYEFDINAVSLPFTIKTARSLDTVYNYTEGVSAQSVEQGKIVFEISDTAPDTLYYGSGNDINAYGLIKVYNIEENSVIDVEKEVLGKKSYTLSNGIKLSNGMKVNFRGEVTPSSYADDEYYVEGVGEAIQLIKVQELDVVSAYAQTVSVPFDSQNFDTVGFGSATAFTFNKDYVVINRASPDKNPWSRHNKWVHRSVIEDSATANGQIANYDQASRAKRPIIEFEAGLKLYNFGAFSKGNVDLIDNITTDVFSTIEGASGYYVDGIQLTEGMKILFTADTDPLVQNKIYTVKILNFTSGGQTTAQISLIENTNSNALLNETVLITNGVKYQGTFFYFDGQTWKQGQAKTSVNQSPLFELFDADGNSFTDEITYFSSNFSGNKVFSYTQGTGTNDSELGFPLTYRNVANTGDIVFGFDLINEEFEYQSGLETVVKKTDTAFLRKYKDRETFSTTTGWEKAIRQSSQRVLRQYVATTTNNNNFAIDVYDNSGDLNDLDVKVFVNDVIQTESTDYVIDRINSVAYVRFNSNLTNTNIVVIKTKSATVKNSNGHYEFPCNLGCNPLNENVAFFTLGQVSDHVKSITNEHPDIIGATPGVSNLRDLANPTKYATRFVQHSGPISLASYVLLRNDINIIKAIKHSQQNYLKFKRSFLSTIDDLGFDGNPQQTVDKILETLNKDNSDQSPFFQTDMLGRGAFKSTTHTVLDTVNKYFALSTNFNLNTLSLQAVYVYHNNQQLVHGIDYTFTDGFVFVSKTLLLNDEVIVIEYETTNGSYIPATPTKLGLYPKFVPQKYLDTTLVNPVNVIQGHDGSVVVAFDDFRDDLILEFERRIYNNIKTSMNEEIIDYKNFVPGAFRSTGFTNETINKILLQDFNEWLVFVGNQDYTANSYQTDSNSLTWNYHNANSPQGTQLIGFWRGIYKHAYDTDRPNIAPWEMLGYTIKPSWWETTYGPAPYTKDNLILWQDLENGVVREPNKKLVTLQQYKRPGLTSHIPVDSEGNIRSPFDSGFAKDVQLQTTIDKFKFGDHAPIENAWRRSSDYPFALLKSYILHQPSKIIGTGWDTSRVSKNSADEIVYSTGLRIKPTDLIFPSSVTDDSVVLTTGLVNYLYEYVETNLLTNYKDYQEQLKTIKTQIGFKIKGYSNKDKFKLLLDSKTPLNSTSLFVPEESYELIFNSSSPIAVLSYSGLIIEKLPSGYSIKGYDKNDPYIRYHNYNSQASDPVQNVGGVSASFISWSENKRYDAGSIVRYNKQFYATETTHISTTTFDTSKFVKLVQLPIEGGAEAIFRRNFSNTVLEISYGTVFSTVQEVVDVILGYSSYLESQGFDFNEYNSALQLVANWQLSAKEFMFWTTQNWDQGSIIALSPASNKLKLKSSYSVADNVLENFYSYGILKEDGNKLSKEFVRIVRESNNFEILTKNTANGIYFAKIPLVQKEHVCLLDNNTSFGDLIYDPASGYKQERIKVLGYITEWDGSQSIPGFIHDEAKVVVWQPYTDYAMSDIVKHKQFYYSANTKLKGKDTFDNTDWRRLDSAPTNQLLSNFDYRANQFEDFYDLDSDNFDSEQQRMAQHLIGYQPREYLRNIINDEVSQYKFYQGMIQEKGTKNALNKMFDALASADKESVEFYEEWAVRKGQYGATAVFDEIEYELDETKIRSNPQTILLTDDVPNTATDLIYRIQSGQVYLKPQNYDHRPFPVKYNNQTYLKTAGTVNPADISITLADYADLLTTASLTDLEDGDYVWIGNYENSWNVFRYTNTDQKISSIVVSGSNILINTLNTAVMSTGEIFVVNANGVDYVFRCISASLNVIECEPKLGFVNIEPATGFIKRFTPSRVETIDAVNEKIFNQGLKVNEKFWIDEGSDGAWKIINNKFVYRVHDSISSTSELGDTSFGTVIAVNQNNTVLVVSQPNVSDGQLYVFTRGSESGTLRLLQIINAPTEDPILSFSNLFSSNSNFGEGVDISPDGNWIVVGAPNAGNLQTEYKGTFLPTSNYDLGNIVKYKQQLWKATNQIVGENPSVDFTTFDASALYKEAIGSSTVNLLIGDSVFANSTTDHLLIRASADQYNGTKIGDRLVLDYLNFNTVYPKDRNNLSKAPQYPFNGAVSPTVDQNVFLRTEKPIVQKVDEILVINLTLTNAQLGDVVSTDTAEGTVVYQRKEGTKQLLYLKNVEGIFSNQAQLFSGNSQIGTYQRVNTEDYSHLGGWWLIEIGATVSTNAGADSTNNVVIVDIKRQGISRTTNNFMSSMDQTWIANTPQTPVYTAQFGITSNYEDYYIDPSTNSWQTRPTTQANVRNQWFLRVNSTTAKNGLGKQIGDTINVWINNVDTDKFTFAGLNIDDTDTNDLQTIADIWQGYIDIDSQVDNNSNFYFPVVGDTVRDNSSGNTAQVALCQFIGLQKLRLWLKNVSGPFTLGSNAGLPGNITLLGTPNRLLGDIEQAVLTGSTDGDLLVFNNANPISIDSAPVEYFANDIEYWVWDELTLDGISRNANIPSSTNKDWIQVFNIPIGEGVQSAFSNEGAVIVYKKNTSGKYVYNSAFTVPDTQTNLRLGSTIKIRNTVDKIIAFVGASGDFSTANPGKIYFIEYTGITWNLSTDPKYMGQFDINTEYLEGELVVQSDQLYKALTNLSAGAFDANAWEVQDSHTDFLGYIPNDSGVELNGDSTINQSGLIRFAEKFDIDKNANTIVCTVDYDNDQKKVAVYRLDSNHYVYKQIITAPEDSSPQINFGSGIAISQNGELIVIGSPLKDLTEIDMGCVYVYKKTLDDTGIFTRNQTLISPSKETSENFGHSLSFNGNMLAVTSLKGDMQVSTMIDGGTTTFDNSMTNFVENNVDTGSIHLYQTFENILIYSEKFVYPSESVQGFGSNLIVKNNHVYVGLPEFALTNSPVGTVVDFRKSPETNNWTSIHESSDGGSRPDLDKIKSVFLYNKKTNKILAHLDYVDPISGKIAGPAEQEIFYKTSYDPAVYNQLAASGVVDTTNSWSSIQVGRLWWNLRTAKYYYPYQSNILFNNAYWNKLFVGASIDVHEWVESAYTPTQWNQLSESTQGESLGVTGTVPNVSNFVLRETYDAVAQVTRNVYYYWVKNKKTVPDLEFRSISAEAVAKLITDPKSQGYKYVTIFGSDKFALVNCDQLITDKDTVLNFRLFNTQSKNNIHNEYAILTEGLASSLPPKDIETVWFNSLIGYDTEYNKVPDPELSDKLKYGTLIDPRQSWFINSAEALKQAITRINNVLINNLIVDEVNLSNLSKFETAPNTNTGLYDQTVDTEKDLSFVGVGNVIQATIIPVIEDGKLIRVTVTNSGKGYKFIPTYTIRSLNGTGAVIQFSIDINGSISSATVVSRGKNYSADTTIVVRPYSVLVRNDSTVDNKWAIYNYTSIDNWQKTRIQSYNVGLYWSYVDWYSPGYSTFTAIDQRVSQSYELEALDNSVGDIVKIDNIGSGGWLLLEKIDNQQGVDYTINYNTVGRQNGTIQFNSKLYDYENQSIGFDSYSFDTQIYDRQPIEETRIILETIRDNIFIEELLIEYNKLFFASIRYALSENKLTDFVFKTSFVKAQHNVGELKQKVTFKNDNLSNFEDYIAEVKPYKSKIREYVSAYEKTEPTNSLITDFDLPPRYNSNGVIESSKVTVSNNVLVDAGGITTYPDKHWRDNIGYKVIAINVGVEGSGYTNPPAVTITGGGGTGATAVAYIKSGALTRIKVTNSGSGYISTPTVAISASTTGTTATASAVLGESLIRTAHIGMKFDRTAGTFLIANLNRTQTFTGNNSRLKFNLDWPIDLRTNTVSIVINGVKQLRSAYTFGNQTDTTKSYVRQTGHVNFVNPPANLSSISITYLIDQDVLQAQDRINLYYAPTVGMPGNDLGQLLDGIDYGGVEVRSIGFEDTSGWDNQPFMQGIWDTYDESYEDEIFRLDGSTQTLDLSKALEDGVQYNVYRNGVRQDDPNFGTSQQTNTNAVMSTIVGDGSTRTVDISAVETGNDIIIIRKSTSDGSFLPDSESVDTLLQGGNLAYSTATGLNAEDILIDGDGFVTPTSSKGPEEVVPGQVMDTLDIQVYDRGSQTGSKISSYHYVGDGSTTAFEFVDYPQSKEAIFVSVNNILINSDQFTIDYQNKNLVFTVAPVQNSSINFITMGNNGESISDVDTFIGDGSTVEFVTRAQYNTTGINTFVKVNGLDSAYTVIQTDSAYAVPNKVAIRFNTAPVQGSVINIVVYESTAQTFSQVTQNTFTGTGSTRSFQLSPIPFAQTPFTSNVIVKVDNLIMTSNFTKQFTVSTLREYAVESWQILPGTILVTNVRAFLNDIELTAAQYRWNPGTSSVTLESGIGSAGDILDVFIDNGQYSVTDTGVLTFAVAPLLNEKITVYQFSKHDVADIERIRYDVIARQTITVNTTDYYQYNQLTNGVVQLRKPAVDAQYVWVCVNGEWLAPSIDYTVSNDQNYLKISRQLSQNDTIDIIHFTAPSFVGKFAYRQFKDMLNKTHFKRIGNDRQYFLAQSLNWYDKEMILTDATGLTTPSIQAKLPGILFVNGERIEYFLKDGNTLKQLRRGTFGTGVPQVHFANTEVVDQSRFQTIQYSDEFISEMYTGADVVDKQLTVGFTPQSANEFELFVGGKRMRKNSIRAYDPNLGQDSPEADNIVPAEFTVNGITPVITFEQTPGADVKIMIVRKQGKIWHTDAGSLSQTENDIARFIRQKEVALPQ